MDQCVKGANIGSFHIPFGCVISSNTCRFARAHAKIDHGTEPLILIISFSTYRASKMEAMAATVQTHITQRTILPGYFMPHTILLCSAKVG